MACVGTRPPQCALCRLLALQCGVDAHVARTVAIKPDGVGVAEESARYPNGQQQHDAGNGLADLGASVVEQE